MTKKRSPKELAARIEAMRVARFCPACDEPLVLREEETPSEFLARQTCDFSCGRVLSVRTRRRKRYVHRPRPIRLEEIKPQPEWPEMKMSVVQNRATNY